MRSVIMMMFLSLAATCYAEDPLETLNTVQDTVSTMEQTLRARASEREPGSGDMNEQAQKERDPQKTEQAQPTTNASAHLPASASAAATTREP